MTVALPVLLTGARAWDLWWLVWLFGLVLLTFAGPEVYAVVTGNGHTFSATMWRWEHLDFSHPFNLAQWTVLRYTVVASVTWLWLHICFGLVR